ncbi:MAG: hypothetical protein HYZ28_24580 [Myxococcales bacterium]|nr:hypothetical protein [Myxococcales bacterium]
MELRLLLSELSSDRSARVAFIVATAACQRAGIERCSPNDLRHLAPGGRRPAAPEEFPVARNHR